MSELTEEIWKDISGYNAYQVSNTGRVRSLKAGVVKILKQISHRDGYLLVNLCNQDGRKLCKVHRLVAIAFIENSSNKTCVDHINRVRTDNNANNLRWVDYVENAHNRSYRPGISGVMGVSFEHRCKRWRANIGVDHKVVFLGYFVEYSDAVNARKNAEALYYRNTNTENIVEIAT